MKKATRLLGIASTAAMALSLAWGAFSGGAAAAAKAPAPVITVGTLYAGSGAFATSSMPEYQGLQFWVNQVNATGGVMVKATHRKEKIKLVAYNDESDVSTATNLYNQLITQNKVNILVSDFGSVLTSIAIPIGLTLPQFEAKFTQATHSTVNFLNVAGYNTGLIIEKTLETSPNLSQLGMRDAISKFSGHITTLDGKFKVDASGAQLGEYLPVGQLLAHGPHTLVAKILT
ncbi:MAG: ABC transporter substrate-binding protein [Firmicutes bacterium]|nr:ABC transporter substrate-binding protein [Bacillota bacterium]